MVGTVGCQPGDETGETVETAEPPPWWESVNELEHLAFRIEIDEEPATDIWFGRNHVTCGRYSTGRLEIYGDAPEHNLGILICNFGDVTDRITTLREEELANYCPERPGWWGEWGQWWHDDSFRTWGTVPDGDTETDECWMDLLYESPNLLGRFQCPYMHTRMPVISSLSLTDGTFRCPVVDAE